MVHRKKQCPKKFKHEDTQEENGNGSSWAEMYKSEEFTQIHWYMIDSNNNPAERDQIKAITSRKIPNEE